MAHAQHHGACTLPSVYQLRVVVRGVSPLIWRRLLIPADTTIAGLHCRLPRLVAHCGRIIWRGLKD